MLKNGMECKKKKLSKGPEKNLRIRHQKKTYLEPEKAMAEPARAEKVRAETVNFIVKLKI